MAKRPISRRKFLLHSSGAAGLMLAGGPLAAVPAQAAGRNADQVSGAIASTNRASSGYSVLRLEANPWRFAQDRVDAGRRRTTAGSGRTEYAGAGQERNSAGWNWRGKFHVQHLRHIRTMADESGEVRGTLSPSRRVSYPRTGKGKPPNDADSCNR